MKKLTASKARKIFKDKRQQKEIAKDYKVSQSLVSEIKNGIYWCKVTNK